MSKQEIAIESRDLFTFFINKVKYAIGQEKVFRFELISSEIIENFNESYFFKYREGIVKVVGIGKECLLKAEKNEMLNFIMIQKEDHLYAFYVDEIDEFITSDFPLETHFSRSQLIKGSIIHDEKIIYVINEEHLDQMLFSHENSEDEAESFSLKLLKEAA